MSLTYVTGGGGDHGLEQAWRLAGGEGGGRDEAAGSVPPATDWRWRAAGAAFALLCFTMAVLTIQL